jgi:AbrB family looped-hinge helix DNA binding protein
MKATIDKAGRLVIPKPLRDQLGMTAGTVEVTADGSALRVEPVTDEALAPHGEWLVIPSSGGRLTSDDVRGLRDADQR